MNTIVKTLTQETMILTWGVRALVISKTMLYTSFLITSILLSAFGVIFIKEKTRGLISEVERLQHFQQIQEIKHNQLLLEENTLLAQKRLKTTAETQLHMQMPTVIHTLNNK